MPANYSVYVGNIGEVYRGEDVGKASENFAHYRDQSDNGEGRAAGEDVTMFEDGEIVDEHFGYLSEDDEHDQFMHDGEADGDALASAGWGTDEDYGCYGGEDY